MSFTAVFLSRAWVVARVSLMTIGLGVLAGCPGEIDDSQRFFEGDHDGDFLPCGMAETCSGAVCHSGDDPAADLDMVAGDLAARMVDVPSSMCEGRLLVDSQNPEESFFLEKVSVSEPECGAPMPFVGEGLSAEEVACVEDFIHDLLAMPSTDAGVPQ